MLITGIICGLLCAWFSSVYYLLSRTASKVPDYSQSTVFALSHAWMGLFSWLLLPLLWPANMPPFMHYGPLVAGSMGFYLLGQASLFRALHHAEASRVSPMLGLKIIILALISVLALHDHLAHIQSLGVGLSVIAALLLNLSGARLTWPAWRAILFAVVFYSMSDTCIGMLIQRLDPVALGSLRAPLLACCLCFACGAPFVLILLRRDRRPTWTHASHGLRLALAWFASMVCLYLAFSYVGVLFGAMLQATRGLMSIGLGYAVARLGHHHLETHVPASVFWRRAASGVLMFAAIALYLLGKR